MLIGLLQYKLWLGEGGIREWRNLETHIQELKEEGKRRQARNAALSADVKDLKEGTDAIEERARRELGMIRPGETFVQVFEGITSPVLVPQDNPFTRPVPSQKASHSHEDKTHRRH